MILGPPCMHVQADYNRSAPAFPWMERHPDREIGTELVGSLTKWLPIRGIRNNATVGKFKGWTPPPKKNKKT